MRRLKNRTSFSVEVAPATWKTLGVISGDVFKRIQAELANIAALLGASDGPPLLPRVHHLTVEGVVATYEVNVESRTLTLIELERRPP